MRMGRRSFLSLMALQALAIREQSKANSFFQPTKLSILQGYTDEDSVEFSVVVPAKQNLSFAVVDEWQNVSIPFDQQTKTRDFSEWAVVKLQYKGLSLASRYQLIVKDKAGKIVDQRNFKLLDWGQEQVRIGIASCMNDWLHRRSLWLALAEAQPDVLFFVGDTCYADFTSLYERRVADPKQLWERYAYTRNQLEIYKSENLTPIFAVWDDHDFGANGAGDDYPYKSEAKEVFETYFAQSSNHSHLEKGAGISQHFTAFGQNFFFLDGRTFRAVGDSREERYFGHAQEEWLYDHLSSCTGHSWLITGSQWFGGYLKKESFEHNYPNHMQDFLNTLKSFDTSVGFVSGDIHFSEFMHIEAEKLGYPTIEITSSSIHSMSVPGWHRFFKNPRRVKATSYHNFNLLNVTADSTGVTGQLRSLGSGGDEFYSVDFDVRK